MSAHSIHHAKKKKEKNPKKETNCIKNKYFPSQPTSQPVDIKTRTFFHFTTSSFFFFRKRKKKNLKRTKYAGIYRYIPPGKSEAGGPKGRVCRQDSPPQPQHILNRNYATPLQPACTLGRGPECAKYIAVVAAVCQDDGWERDVSVVK